MKKTDAPEPSMCEVVEELDIEPGIVKVYFRKLVTLADRGQILNRDGAIWLRCFSPKMDVQIKGTWSVQCQVQNNSFLHV